MEAWSWIVAVGDEILSGHTQDGNSHYLAERLRSTPHPAGRIVVVPDRVHEIVEVLHEAQGSGASRVFCCGGLGPTPDDRTAAAVASFLDVPLVQDPGTVQRIRDRVAELHRRGRLPSPEPNPGNLKMAQVPAGALVLRNPVGSAPPLAIPLSPGERWLLVLPGVPAELRAIIDEEVLPRFCSGEGAVAYAEEHFVRTPESLFYPLLLELESEFPDVRFGSYPQANPGDVVLRACAADRGRLQEAMETLRRQAPRRG